MLRFVRISIVLLVASAGAAAVHRALGLGPEFVGPGLGGVVDVGLLIMAGLITSFSDREYFGLVPSKDDFKSHRPQSRN